MDWLTHNVFFLVIVIVWIAVTVFALGRGSSASRGATGSPSTDRDGNNQRRPLHLQTVCWTLGVWAAVSFLVCVLWGLATPEALHMHTFLEQILPAFTWLTGWGFVLGLIESFLMGVYVGLVFVPIYNFFSRRFNPAG